MLLLQTPPTQTNAAYAPQPFTKNTSNASVPPTTQGPLMSSIRIITASTASAQPRKLGASCSAVNNVSKRIASSVWIGRRRHFLVRMLVIAVRALFSLSVLHISVSLANGVLLVLIWCWENQSVSRIEWPVDIGDCMASICRNSGSW